MPSPSPLPSRSSAPSQPHILPPSPPPTLTLHPSSHPILTPYPIPPSSLTPHPIPPCGSHDSVITNPVLGWSAMMDYVSDWQTALGYGEEAAAAPAARG